MSRITTRDGTEIFYKDWGSGPPVVFSHGWPLSSDVWDEQMLFFAERGYRCIAHDRRGHGRSGQPWHGNDLDTYADDLATLLDTLELTNAILVGHSTGCGEIARYIAWYGSRRVAKVVLIAASPPLLLRRPVGPKRPPSDAFDGLRGAVLDDRSRFFKDLSLRVYGRSQPNADTSTQGLRYAFWLQGMQAGLKGVLDSIETLADSYLTDDLKKLDVPTLILHGSADQLVPFGASALTAQIVSRSTLKVYPGAQHGLYATHRHQVNGDLLAFFSA